MLHSIFITAIIDRNQIDTYRKKNNLKCFVFQQQKLKKKQWNLLNTITQNI